MLSSNFTRAQMEHKQLLYNLKTTIDTLFLVQSGDVFSNVGALPRLHTAIENIFLHGIRIYKPDGKADLWRFIEALNWLNPSMSISIAQSTNFAAVHIPYSRIKTDRALVWIYENLKNNILSQKLSWLISDFEHLSSCYEVTAFIRNEKYISALFLCLKAIENSQPNLLSQIDPCLFIQTFNTTSQHKRSSSHPEFTNIALSKKQSPENSTQPFSIKSDTNNKSLQTMGNSGSQPFSYNDSVIQSHNVSIECLVGIDVTPTTSTDCTPKKFKKSLKKSKSERKKVRSIITNFNLRPSRSLPSIHVPEDIPRIRSRTISQPIHIPCRSIRLTAEALAKNEEEKKVPSFTYKDFALQSDYGSSGDQILPQAIINDVENQPSPNMDLVPIQLVKCDDIKIYFDKKHTPKVNTTTNMQHDILNVVETPNINENNASCSPQTPTHRNLFSLFSPRKPLYQYFDSSERTGTTEYGRAYANFLPGSSPSDFVNTFKAQHGEKIQNRYKKSSILEDLTGSPLSAHNLDQTYFTKPTRGQSLASFLQTAQFSRTNSELERENAHFSVSEAMIAAIEQLKWTKTEKFKQKLIILKDISNTGTNQQSTSKSNRRLKQWDCEDEPNEMFEKRRNGSLMCNNSDDEGKRDDDDNDEDDDISFDVSSTFNNSDDSSDEENFPKGLSVSMQNITEDHTAYAEWGENSFDALSAEGVALSLIAKFKDKQLPKASDFLWLVSEQDAPQRLLPMPGSHSVNPDDKYNMNSFMRGTRDWAPPRPQIIFTRHPRPNRRKLMHQQNQRCAGCGMRVAKAYSHRYRYCEYLGKYHCTGCHRNQISAIPARIIDKWDFSCHPVSVFSYRLLDQIWSLPLFRIPDLNPMLYIKIKSLKLAREKRINLKFIHDFIKSCRFADKEKELFEKIPNHLTTDIEMWAMNDLIAVRNGSFNKDVNTFITKCEQHIFNCELCTARGFVCEMCTKKLVIFPWQSKVKRCNECGNCVHENCWQIECSKCLRLKKRQTSPPTSSGSIGGNSTSSGTTQKLPNSLKTR